MKSVRRVLALLVLLLTATSVALAAPAGRGTAFTAAPVPPLKLLKPTATLGPARRPGAFPVHGRVGYGESGARFGADRGGRRHEGQDVFAPAGTPLVAMSDGVVVEAGDGGGRGNYVAIYDPAAGLTYVYLHLQDPASVRSGQRVRAGRRVGRVGCTGSCFGDHLHLEVRRGRGTQGKPVDPLPLLRRLARG